MSVTVPEGFTAAGIASGIKKEGELDLAVIAAPPGTIGAGVFTVNKAAAPPVMLSRTHLAASSSFRAVTINSGCANAATGDSGTSSALAMAETTALAIGCRTDEVFVASTGKIGPQLPTMQVTAGIESAIKQLRTGFAADQEAAAAIMTTDSLPKQAVANDAGVTVGGIAKGAGMLRPDMATMLVVLTTDAVVKAETLHVALAHAVDRSFNSLNIDGCQSTNDSVFVLASGASGVSADTELISGLLTDVSRNLSHQIAADAEGATRVVTIEVTGALSDTIARKAGKAVADSALVRSTFYGGDLDWGRVVSALGAADIDFDLSEVSVAFGGQTLAFGGQGVEYDDSNPLQLEGDFTVEICLGPGPGSADVLTTDLTPDYVLFNAGDS